MTISKIFWIALIFGCLCSPLFAQNIVTMPNVFGGQNIYVPGQAPITTMPNVFGGQNIYIPNRPSITTMPNVFGGQNVYDPAGVLGDD